MADSARWEKWEAGLRLGANLAQVLREYDLSSFPHLVQEVQSRSAEAKAAQSSATTNGKQHLQSSCGSVMACNQTGIAFSFLSTGFCCFPCHSWQRCFEEFGMDLICQSQDRILFLNLYTSFTTGTRQTSSSFNSNSRGHHYPSNIHCRSLLRYHHIRCHSLYYSSSIISVWSETRRRSRVLARRARPRSNDDAKNWSHQSSPAFYSTWSPSRPQCRLLRR